MRIERWVAYGNAVSFLMPVGTRIVHVDFNPTGAMTITGLTRPSDAYETRRFEVFFTGSPIPDGAAYLGTATADDHFGGRFHWHIFELGD
jgi:hypothetical protein